MFELGKNVNNKYTILEILGKGGFGSVYKVASVSGEHYALKICFEKDEDLVKRFKREIRILKSIASSRVVQIIDDGEIDDFYYYVMPLADGNLEDVLNKIHKNELKCLEVFREICLGIMDLHSNGLIHRDIKPANVLLKNRKLIISDLGLGKFENRDSSILTNSLMYMGTEGYIPPEFIKERGGTKNASAVSDIYQLGKLLYAMFSGENPIVVSDDNLPISVATILNKTTSPMPSKRIQTVSALIPVIDKFIELIRNPTDDLKFFSELEKAN